MLDSEFRDGNVPAGHEQLRVLKESLRHLPDSMKKVSLCSDTAGYQEELLLYCGEGKDPRFGVIEFAIGADVTEAFRAAVRTTPESAWKPLIRKTDGQPQQTDQEWAEVSTCPIGPGTAARADYRFLAIREPLRQLALGDEAKLPFSTQAFGPKGVYKLFAVVTNRTGAGEGVIWWLRERCGKSEEFHRANEIRPGGRTDALWALRSRNAAWWVLHDPGVQSKRRDPASGAGREMGGQTHEGAALPSDRPARTGGQPRPPADHSSGRRGQSAGHPPRRPPKDPGAGAGTGRMSPNRALPSVDLISRSVPWRGDDALRYRKASPTRPGCTQSSPDLPCVSTNVRR